MVRIREIDHLVLRVYDIERMRRFYCDVLGARSSACRTCEWAARWSIS